MSVISYNMYTVIGIETIENKKVYRVAVFEVKTDKDKNVSVIKGIDKRRLAELELKQLIASNKRARFLNIKLDEKGNLVGNPAALTRFEQDKVKPVVILSQIVSIEDKNVVGYKYITFQGDVHTKAVKHIIAHGKRCKKEGLIPIQNAQFVDSTEDVGAHIKAYPGSAFLVEEISTGKNKYTEKPVKVQVKQNEKKYVSARELFSNEQLLQLKLGKESGVDFRIYANPELSAEQMKELRLGLESGANVRMFASPAYKADCMTVYIDCLLNKVDIRKFLSPKYNSEQLVQLDYACEFGLDISQLCNPSLSAVDMQEIILRLENNIWKKELLKADGTWL